MEQTKKKTAKRYSSEFRERVVRLAIERRDDYQSEAAVPMGVMIICRHAAFPAMPWLKTGDHVPQVTVPATGHPPLGAYPERALAR